MLRLAETEPLVIVGAGYVGLVTGACLAAVGRTITLVNEQQRMRFVQKIRDALGSNLEGRRIALLGLAFKPGTDDLRQAPSIAIANRLVELGACVVAHDPVAMDEAQEQVPEIEFAVVPTLP